MDFEDIVYKRRTIRRFKQEPIDLKILKKLIDLARVAPMARNIQALEFIIIQNSDIREKIFTLVNWAASLPPDQRTPEKGREPTAYIVVLLNTNIKSSYVDFDVGAAVENILLGAVNYGIGSCWMGSIKKIKIRKLLEIPDYYEIKHVISLGYSDEESIIETYQDSFNYWKTSDGQIHVPKRTLDDIIFKIF
ncbi:MAG: nitroreductase family protein [Candidatus Hermodarchaeota archaeon]